MSDESMAATATPPTTARVVVIGGGAVGCSVLYHLALAGWRDCVLLEKNELTSGSTWHAAGNCPTFSTSWAVLKMQSYSCKLFQTLGETVDYPMNYHMTGSIRIAHTKERMQEFEHVVSMARHMGVELEMLDNAGLKDRYPYLETHDLVGGLWDTIDGDIDPAQLTQAYAKGARDLGQRIVRFCPATGVRRENGEWVVETEKGEIRCEKVVNAAGYRAQEVGDWFRPFSSLPNRRVPMATMAHQYLITEEIPQLVERAEKLPLLRDPDSSYYLRQEKNGLLLGPYEKGGRAHWHAADDPMPGDFSFQLYPDDLERLEWYIEDACARVPLLATGGVSRVVNGPIPYAPDGLPLVGPMPGVPDAYEACVFTFGIVQSGGTGKLLAEWIVEGEPETDSWGVDPRRFTDFATHEYTLGKAVEVYSHEYAMHFPGIQWPVGRNAKTSPLFDRLKEKGAVFGAFGGWERALWFPAEGASRETATGYVRQHWHDQVGRECAHIAEHVGALDLGGFTRLEVSGPGAADWLRGVVTGGIPKVGRIGLAYVATPKGKIQTEMTITRLEEDRFWLLGAAAALFHDQDVVRAHLPSDGAVRVDDRTGAWTTLLVTGPKSRELLARIAKNDFSNAAFPWLSHQPVEIGMATGVAIRVSFAGELGWELHLPAEYARDVYDRLFAVGDDLQLRDFGMLALDSMRLEKGYGAWKHEMSADYTLYDLALDRWVKADKGPFPGREALAAVKADGAKLAPAILKVTADPDAPVDAVPLSTVFQDDRPVGLVTSGGYGHRTGQSIALAVIDRDAAAAGTALEVEIVGVRRPAVVSGAALYDPENARLKA